MVVMGKYLSLIALNGLFILLFTKFRSLKTITLKVFIILYLQSLKNIAKVTKIIHLT